MKKIRHGIFEESTVILNPRPISSIFPINSHEFICTSNREISRIENDDVKETALFSFSCACLIPEVELVVAHTNSGAEIYLMRMYDLTHPILSKFKTGHICVYHIIYSPKSRTIITIGSGIKVFTISWEYTGARLLTSNSNIKLVLRSSFADDYDAPLVNRPSFDYERELFFLPTENGVYGFDLDGNKKFRASRLPTTLTTIFTFCQETKRLLTADATTGICLWKKTGYIKKKIDFISYVIIALQFVDTENVICLSSTYSLYLLNVKTGTSSLCFTCPPNRRLTRFCVVPHLKRMYGIMIFSNKMNFLRVDNLCHVWASNLVRPLSISIFSKYYEAPRIAVFTDNSFVKLYNPRNGFQLTAATCSNPSIPISYYYDRGILIHYVKEENSNKYTPLFLPTDYGVQRDYLYIICQDGVICKFDTMQTPAEQVWIKNYKALYMTTVYYQNRWCYAVMGIHGKLSLVDMNTFEKIKDILAAKRPVRFMLYHYQTNSLIFMMKKSLKLFSLETEHFTAKTKVTPTDLAYLYGDTVYLAYKTGKIYRYTVSKTGFQYIEPEVLYDPHTDSVTSMNFSQEYYLSSSLDRTCLIWNYNHAKLTQIELPFPIYSIAFHGPKRHILVGIKDEIMLIPGDVLFDENHEKEIQEIDNYNLLYDPLDPKVIAKRHLDEMAEAKSFLNQTQVINHSQIQDPTLLSNVELIPVSEPASFIRTIVIDTPEMRKKKIEQMYNLLNLGKSEESSAMILANQNARHFIQRAKIESQQKLESKAMVNTIEVPYKTQNSIQPRRNQLKKVVASEFIRSQIEIEDKNKKNPRRNKKKKQKKAEENNKELVIDKSSNINLLEMLNKKDKVDKSPKTSPRVQIDITKMKFIECTTDNKEEPKQAEYEYYSDDNEADDQKPKKKKRKIEPKKPPKHPIQVSNPCTRQRSNTIQPNRKPANKNSSQLANTVTQKKDKVTITQDAKFPHKIGNMQNQRQRHNTITAKSKKHQPAHSKQQVNKLSVAEVNDLLNETSNNREFIDENGQTMKLNNDEYINSNGEIVRLTNFEYINKDGQVCELPKGRFVNEKGQIVNQNGDLIDENGEIICNDNNQRKWYLYLDEYGKIQHYLEEERKHPNFDNCIFYDQSGRIINKDAVLLNDFGEYVDIFGEILIRCEIVESGDGENLLENGLIFHDYQLFLVNQNGQRVNANGELVSQIQYADSACQCDEQLIERAVNAKINKLKKYFNPKDRGYRPLTPPPIRWVTRISSNKEKEKRINSMRTNSLYLQYLSNSTKNQRSRTPPQLRSRESINERKYVIPSPQYVLDCEAVLSVYGRGHTELLPIIYRLIREGLVSPLNVPIPMIVSNDKELITSIEKSDPAKKPYKQVKKGTSFDNFIKHERSKTDIQIKTLPPNNSEVSIMNEQVKNEFIQENKTISIMRESEIVTQEEEDNIEVIFASDDASEIEQNEKVTKEIENDSVDNIVYINIGTSTPLKNELDDLSESHMNIIKEYSNKLGNEKEEVIPPAYQITKNAESTNEKELDEANFKPQASVDSQDILKKPIKEPIQSFSFWKSPRKLPNDTTFQLTSCIPRQNEEEVIDDKKIPAPRKLYQRNEDQQDNDPIRKKRNQHRDQSPPSPHVSYIDLPLYEENDDRQRRQTIRFSRHQLKVKVQQKKKKKEQESKHGTIKDYSFLLHPKEADGLNELLYKKKLFEEEAREDFIFSLKSMFPKTNRMAMMIQKEEPEAVMKAPPMRKQSYVLQEKKVSHKRGISVQKKSSKKSKSKHIKDQNKRQKSVDPKQNDIPDYVFLPTAGQRSYLYV